MILFYRDEEIEIDKIRQIRNNLCDLMKIPRPLLKKVWFLFVGDIMDAQFHNIKFQFDKI
jgi:hypothetical protein